MKKLLWTLFILLVLALGFLYIVKNPELPISQKILTTLGIDMTVNEGTGVDLTNCISYFDGCNTCTVASGQVAACTKMYCETPAEPQCLLYEWTGMDLSGCVSYFDGCNNCTVKDGRPDACTLMYCETPAEPKCNAYMTWSELTWNEATIDITNTSNYSIKDWALYFNSNKLYGDKFQTCEVDQGQLGFEAINILFENNDYLVFNVLEWPCGWEPWIWSMLLQKSDNVSNQIILGNNYYSYEDMKWDIIYLNEYKWQIPQNPWRGIENKWYYETYNCPECWIVFLKEIQININDLTKYITSNEHFPKLIP